MGCEWGSVLMADVVWLHRVTSWMSLRVCNRLAWVSTTPLGAPESVSKRSVRVDMHSKK